MDWSLRLWPASLGLALLGLARAVDAQPPPQAPPSSAKAAARTDLTGQWVAQVTEDWRWRMITPPKGDYASVPLTPMGRQLADGWDPAKDEAAGEACRAFGAGGIMRQPTRLRIAWKDENSLEIKTDSGEQTRLFHFERTAAADTEPSWQGRSVAEWMGGAPAAPFFVLVAPTREAATARGAAANREPPPGAPAAAARGAARPASAPPAGALKVTTTGLKPGYLRKNGVPYSGQAVITEYYDRVSMFGNDYLQVVTIVTDPAYLRVPFAVSNHFKLERDESKWRPTPCATAAPLGTFVPSQFLP
jgi:hypothetical protein